MTETSASKRNAQTIPSVSSTSLPGIDEYFPVNGTVNALFIFVQFPETNGNNCFQFTGYNAAGEPVNQYVNNYYPNCSGRGYFDDTWELNSFNSPDDHPTKEWPGNLPFDPVGNMRTRQLPVWAQSGFIDPPNSSQITSGSITDLYNRLSNGRFTIRGYVYPKTYETQFSQAVYATTPAYGANEAAAEILAYVNANPMGLPLSDAIIWDKMVNGSGQANSGADGYVDLIVLVYRYRANVTLEVASRGSGIAAIGSTGDTSWGPGIMAPKIGNLNVNPAIAHVGGSGVSVQGTNKKAVIQITMHEIGHWQFGRSHTMDFSNQAILQGTNFKSIMVGSETFQLGFSAPDRLFLGWAKPKFLTKQNLEPFYYTDAYPYSLSTAYNADTTGFDVLVFQQVAGQYSAGDIIIEARKFDNINDNRPDVSNKGLAQEGLLVYKVSQPDNWPNFASDVPHSNGGGKRGVHGINELDGITPADTYTPFSKTGVSFSPSGLDSTFAITDIVSTSTGYSFKIWKDFKLANMVNKAVKRYTAFDKNTIMWKNASSAPTNNTWYVNGHFRMGDPLTITQGALTGHTTAGWKGITMAHGGAKIDNFSLLNLSDVSGNAGVRVWNVNARVSNTRIETKSGTSNYPAVLTDGIYASSVEFYQNTVVSRSGPAVKAINGSYVSVYKNKLEVTGGSYPVLEAPSNSIIATWLAATVYVGENQIKGGSRGLFAGSGATVNAGNGTGYNNNQFCDAAAAGIGVSSGGLVYAKYNYWPTAAGATLYNSGGTIHWDLGSSSSPSTCAGIFKANPNTLPPIANQEEKLSIEAVLAQPFFLEKTQKLEWLNNALPELLKAQPAGKVQILTAAVRVSASAGVNVEPLVTALETEVGFEKNIVPETILFLASYWIASENKEKADYWLARLPEIRAKTGENATLQNSLENTLTGYRQVFGTDPVKEELTTKSGRGELADGISLEVYPNPFNPTTQLKVSVSKPGVAVIALYDLSGRLVTQLHEGFLQQGGHEFAIRGNVLASGIYLVRVKLNDKVKSLKINFIK